MIFGIMLGALAYFILHVEWVAGDWDRTRLYGDRLRMGRVPEEPVSAGLVSSRTHIS
jgi:hypothetical protein